MAMQEPAPKARWTLDQRSLDSLLSAFHPERQQASYAYEALRERLIRFFEWNHADTPQELADETLDRLARRLSAGEDEILDPAKFAAGIARLLLKEHFRENDRREAALATMAEFYLNHAKVAMESTDREERMEVLEHCLQAIPEASRNLIERYFSAESRTQIQHRQRLAEEHGISANALRNRVMRIRAELERRYALRFSRKTSPAGEMFHQKLSQYDEQ
ncbi:MAG: RNA polymerase sigma factor [Acidobacteriaceae bacterium]